MILWDFPVDIQARLVAAALSKYGELRAELSTPHSSIYTFDRGSNTTPRYIVAKGVRFNDSMSVSDKKRYLERALHEVNNAYAVCHHELIHRFSYLEVVYGIPFLLSRKRDATLRDIIAEGPLTESEAVSIAIQVVHGLNYCETKGLRCHQDLKPENIFVDIIGKHFEVPSSYPLRHRAFIADFELANAYLMLRHPFGSRPYMPPEQYQHARDDRPAPDFSRVDVFALGVILYEMISGGVHPIGEHISLIWPTPAEGKSRKWMREDPWKQWLERGAEMTPVEGLDSSWTFEIIRCCLKTESAVRISKNELEKHLLQGLKKLNVVAFQSLTLLLNQYDLNSRESEAAGWPDYDERVQQLNETFSDGPSP
jgi:serine/threonine protein kinase